MNQPKIDKVKIDYEKLCEELKEIARKGELGAGDLEIVHKLTDTIKNLYKIEMTGGTRRLQPGW